MHRLNRKKRSHRSNKKAETKAATKKHNSKRAARRQSKTKKSRQNRNGTVTTSTCRKAVLHLGKARSDEMIKRKSGKEIKMISNNLIKQ